MALKRRAGGADSPTSPAAGVGDVALPSSSDVLLRDRSEWLLVQSRYLRLWKRRFVVVERERITAHDLETDLSKPVYTIACHDITEVAQTREDPFAVVVKLRGDIYYRIKFSIIERAQDWVAAVALRSLKKSK